MNEVIALFQHLSFVVGIRKYKVDEHVLAANRAQEIQEYAFKISQLVPMLQRAFLGRAKRRILKTKKIN